MMIANHHGWGRLILSELEIDPQLSEGAQIVIPVLIGIGALIALPIAALFAMGSGMLFDAPGSERNPFTWLLVLLLWASPFVTLATIALAVQVFQSFSSRRLNLLILLPTSWWLVYFALQLVSQAVCGRGTVCS